MVQQQHKGSFGLIFPVVLFFFLNGCSAMTGNLELPEFEVTDVKVGELSLTEATPYFKLRITNPNSVAINLDKVEYDLKINEKDFASGVYDAPVRLPANGSGSFDVPVKVKYWDLFRSVSNVALTRSADYEISGKAHVGYLSVPFSKKGQFDIPSPPGVSLERLAIDSMTFGGARMTAAVAFENPNGFAMKMNSLKFDLVLGNQKVADGFLAKNVDLKKEGKTVFDFPFQVDFVEIGQSFLNLFSDKVCDYELKGTYIMEAPDGEIKEFAFSEKKQIPLISR